MAEGGDIDAELMLQVQKGDMAAFEQLVEKYQRPVVNLLHRTLGDATEAEDLAQNVFVQVFKSAPRYRVTARFSTWLFTIARNLCLNEIRRRSRHPAQSLDQPVEGDEGESDGSWKPAWSDPQARRPGDSILQDELEQKIEEALGQLPEAQRTALLLCRQEELSYEEIAEILGCSLSATKSLIHRAREVLRARLKPYLASGQWRKK